MYMAITLKFISQLTNHLFCLMWYTDIVYLLCSSSGPREADGIVMSILQMWKLRPRQRLSDSAMVTFLANSEAGIQIQVIRRHIPLIVRYALLSPSLVKINKSCLNKRKFIVLMYWYGKD